MLIKTELLGYTWPGVRGMQTAPGGGKRGGTGRDVAHGSTMALKAAGHIVRLYSYTNAAWMYIKKYICAINHRCAYQSAHATETSLLI